MSDEKVLTKEIAEQFLADEDSVDLSEFTAIEDEAAEVLKTWRTFVTTEALCLDGLTAISPAAATAIATLPLKALYLRGLKELPYDVAIGLSTFPRGLILSGLNSITDPVCSLFAERFKQHRYSASLYVCGIKELGTSVGHLDLCDAIVANRSNTGLKLNHLKILTPECANRLVNYKNGNVLELNAISFLTLDLASSLFESDLIINLNGLTELPEDVVDCFCSSRCFGLESVNLLSLSDHSRELLSRIRLKKRINIRWTDLPGTLTAPMVNNPLCSDFHGVNTISLEAAEMLAKQKYRRLQLPDVRQLESHTAEKLFYMPWEEVKLGLSTLEVSVAKCIHTCSSVSLPDLTEVIDEVATHLCSVPESLNLESLNYISDSAAAELAEFDGPYLKLDCFSGPEWSEGKLLLLKRVVNTNQDSELMLTSIDDCPDFVAKCFEGHAGRLYLNGVCNLTDSSAQILSLHAGDYLELQSLLALNNSEGNILLAKRLARNNGPIDLYALRTIGIGPARALAKAGKQTIITLGLEEMTVELAAELAKCKGELKFRQIRELDAACAFALSQSSGTLDFPSLCSLDGSKGHIELAKKLARQGMDVKLPGLVKADSKAISALSKTEEDVSLPRVRHLDEKAVKALATSKSDIIELGSWQYRLDGKWNSLLLARLTDGDLSQVTFLTDEAAENLRKYKGDELQLDGLTSLSDAAAESLSKYKGDSLDLGGLTSLSDAAAESLSKYKGDSLDLLSLISLSDAAAENLRKYKGDELQLKGLTSLSDSAAASLSECIGDLNIDLDDLPDSAAAILRKHPSFADED
jgi:hypothetical protein